MTHLDTHKADGLNTTHGEKRVTRVMGASSTKGDACYGRELNKRVTCYGHELNKE